jgi:AcrR family transcriptional regulator
MANPNTVELCYDPFGPGGGKKVKVQGPTPRRQSHRRARGSLTADTIVETAFAISADSSVDELSIPLVAKSLGVGVTSIYWHVRNKSELLDAMTDRALRRSGLPTFVESDDWREALMTHARGVRQTFLGDPVLTDLILIRGALSPLARRLGAQETGKAIASMIEGGLDQQTAQETYAAVSELVRGSVLLKRLADKHSAASQGDFDDDDRGFANAALSQDNQAFELLLTSLLANVERRIAD